MLQSRSKAMEGRAAAHQGILTWQPLPESFRLLRLPTRSRSPAKQRLSTPPLPTSLHLEALQLAYTITNEVGIPSHGLNAAFSMAQAHLELGDRKHFVHWVSVAEDLYGRIDEPVASNYAVALFCRRAIEEGDNSSAREIFERFSANQPRLPADRAAAYTLGLQVGIELLDDAWRPHDALLAALQGRFNKVAPFGTCDFLCSVLLECLIRRGEFERARDALSHYTKFQRREVSPLGHRLSMVAARIAAGWS